MGDPQKRYPPELKERAVRMVLEARAADPNDHLTRPRPFMNGD